MKHIDKLISDIKSIDNISIVDNDVVTDIENRDINIELIEKQTVFNWLRVYLRDEYLNIKEGDILKLKYKPTQESLELIFNSYSKQHTNDLKEFDGSLISYDPVDDKKVLCLMFNEDNLLRDDINFIRSLMKGTKYYEEVLYKRSDLILIHNDIELDYYDIDF